MTLHIIDTHAHLDMPEFDTDRASVIERAEQAGVKNIVTIGIDLKSSRIAVELAQAHPGVYAAVGIHPSEAERASEGDIAQLLALVGQPKVVALGEMGLDFYRNNSTRQAQLKVFGQQLELSNETALPIIIHCRQALSETLEILGKWSLASPLKEAKGIIHCFSGDLPTVRAYIEMGFYLALGGYIGYPSSLEFREVIRDIPLNRLVLETDCPFLPPQQYRGKRNEPSFTLMTMRIIAEIKNLTVEEIARQTTANARTVFRLPS